MNKPIISGSLIPLLLPCGHSTCSGCVKKTLTRCLVCDKKWENVQKLPMNLFILGLLISSSHRILENDDQDFGFCQTVTRRSQIKHQG